ncbi:NlpC/P60 family protein [Pelosinus sp. sgz500959]|uniref:C40 family peptidase n=1 Tax=Pelosinus sp. sgz500959 TaxID=3242472 RepID=UPI0036716C1B
MLMFRKMMLILIILSFMSTISFAASRQFSEGDAGKEIAEIQVKLKAQGYYRDVINGKFTVEMKKSVKAFQKKNKLEPDGVVGEKTYFVLMGKNMINKPITSEGGNQSNTAEKITGSAMQLVGIPYKWGGVTTKGFDCSGMVWYVFDKNSVSLPRTADVQYKMGKTVGRDQLKQGDLVFFTTYEPGASHSGIYLEKGKFIHVSAKRGVMVSNLSDEYWNTRYLGARRFI